MSKGEEEIFKSHGWEEWTHRELMSFSAIVHRRVPGTMSRGQETVPCAARCGEPDPVRYQRKGGHVCQLGLSFKCEPPATEMTSYLSSYTGQITAN